MRSLLEGNGDMGLTPARGAQQTSEGLIRGALAASMGLQGGEGQRLSVPLLASLALSLSLQGAGGRRPGVCWQRRGLFFVHISMFCFQADVVTFQLKEPEWWGE